MKYSALPTRQPVPFATNAASANKRAIPATQPAGSPGAASYSTGFPPETMEPIASGGTPPFGQDFNGLFFDVTNELRWAQAGGTYTYDSTFSTSIGGYPAGAVLKSAVASVLWISTADDNTTDPDGASAANWVAFRPNSGRAALAVVSGDLTPTAANLLCCLLSITGDATNLTTTLRLPLVAGASYLVNNATTGTGSTLNVQGATGSGVSVAQGQATVVFCDGTNYYSAGSSGSGQYLPIDGTAVAATKLATARAFNLTGPVTAAAQNFDGTGNVTLTTAVADGAFTIAKTSGLQTALDGKLGLGGGTLTGSLNGTTATFSGSITGPGGVALLGNSSGLGANDYLINFYANRWLTYNSAQDRFSFGNASLHVDTGHVSSPSFISPSSNWVAGPGSPGTMYLRPNGVGSTTGQAQLNPNGSLNLNSSGLTGTLIISDAGANGANFALSGNGATTPNKTLRAVNGQFQIVNHAYTAVILTLDDAGNLTAATGNFTGSDARLKSNIKAANPRPLHRTIKLHSYTLKSSGKHSKGPIAQHVLRACGWDYAGEFDHETGKRLSVDKQGLALEIAMWAANEVDRVRSRARLERWVLAGLAIAALLAKAL